MKGAVSPLEVRRFGEVVARSLGLRWDEREHDLGAVLVSRLSQLSIDSEAYLQLLREGHARREELRVLADRLTIAETYFFRDANHFHALVRAVIPACMRARAPMRRLRILSAGCASGEEAYTVAMLLRDEVPELATWAVSIVGIDVNPRMVERASRACYSEWALRSTSPATRERHFRRSGREYTLHDDIRSRVSFEERNLVDDDGAFWRRDAFDVVFCRNVTMYFPPETTRAVIARMTRALTPGGHLFLGHAETLRGISNDYHLRHTHEAFYYQRRCADEEAISHETPHRPAADEPALGGPSEHPWLGAIQKASDHIEALSRASRSLSSRPPPSAEAAPAPPQRPAKKSFDMQAALELIREDRVDEALSSTQTLTTGPHADPDARLLRAVLLTNSGNRQAAESACRELLRDDEMHADGHYLAALLSEKVGALDAADHYQTAAYLDPTFAMPRLQLGILRRRAGELSAAKHELERAMVLLPHEPPARIVLFGGGFTREALLRLCRAELIAAGGTP